VQPFAKGARPSGAGAGTGWPLALLRDSGYRGVLSMECEGQGGPLIEKSLGWLRSALDKLGIPEEK